jgi:hypothetical protein
MSKCQSKLHGKLKFFVNIQESFETSLLIMNPFSMPRKLANLLSNWVIMVVVWVKASSSTASDLIDLTENPSGYRWCKDVISWNTTSCKLARYLLDGEHGCQVYQQSGQDPSTRACVDWSAPQWSRDSQWCVDDAGWSARTQIGTKPSQANTWPWSAHTWSSWSTR